MGNLSWEVSGAMAVKSKVVMLIYQVGLFTFYNDPPNLSIEKNQVAISSLSFKKTPCIMCLSLCDKKMRLGLIQINREGT